MKKFKRYATSFLKWMVLGIITGIICGVLGALFSKSIAFVTDLRTEKPWLLFLLPIGGLISALVYRLFKIDNIGTNQVLASTHSDIKSSPLLAPAVYIGSVITHLFGGSAGREGAALQIGGSIATLIGKILKLNEKERRMLIICGMGALFSAVFGTPLGACVFALEVVRAKGGYLKTIFPAFVSSITAFKSAVLLGVRPERFSIGAAYNLNWHNLLCTVVIGAAGAVISMLFCKGLKFTERLFKRVLKNTFLRIASGGIIIILLTVIIGTNDYNGSGIEIISDIFAGKEVGYEAFLLKIVFTSVTVAAGFKGGEIIPAFFVGATFGSALATLLGFDSVLGASVGMIALFCGVTNCPIATFVLSAELFGINGIAFYFISVVISFFLSGKSNLYEGQSKSLEAV